MKKILFRKLLLDCLKFFAISLLSAGVIIWVFQAVNFLDIIVEDGHNHILYIKYILLNFPKIIGKIFSFVMFFSFSYVLAKYELNNELIVFWSHGVTKIQLINFFLKFSIILVFFQIILSSIFIPKTQELSRNFLKESNIDFFDNFIKPKKFNDTIKNLTIYADSKDDKGFLRNIYMKKGSFDNFQVTYAKKGIYNIKNGVNLLTLYDGNTINNSSSGISNFSFLKSDFNLSEFETNSITSIKTQETSTIKLFKCIIFYLENNLSSKNNYSISQNCRSNNLDNIYKELYKRHIIPFYIPILIIISLMHILRSKEKVNYDKYRTIIFIIGLLTIIFSETSLKFISKNILLNSYTLIIPIIIYSIFYMVFFYDLKLKTKKNYENLH